MVNKAVGHRNVSCRAAENAAARFVRAVVVYFSACDERGLACRVVNAAAALSVVVVNAAGQGFGSRVCRACVAKIQAAAVVDAAAVACLGDV